MEKSTHKSFRGQERVELEELCRLCVSGTPQEVLEQVKKCGLTAEDLKKKYWVYDASPIPVHPACHPFLTACLHGNYPVVRLLMELGADPDADCCATTFAQTPRQAYADNAELQRIFDEKKL